MLPFLLGPPKLLAISVTQHSLGPRVLPGLRLMFPIFPMEANRATAIGRMETSFPSSGQQQGEWSTKGQQSDREDTNERRWLQSEWTQELMGEKSCPL